MKAKKFFLFVMCIVLCILFVACSNEPTPQANDPQLENPYEKMEDYGFEFVKSDNVLPTIESLPEELQDIATHPNSLAAQLENLSIVPYGSRNELVVKLSENPDCIPQLVLLTDAAYKSGKDLSSITAESKNAISEFGKTYGLWP